MKRRAMRDAAVAIAILTLPGMQGCNKSFQVIVPPAFHGTVVINCSSVGTPSSPIVVNEDGAGHGTCPPFQSTIEIVRDGQRARMQRAPLWDSSADGNTSTIRFVVQP